MIFRPIGLNITNPLFNSLMLSELFPSMHFIFQYLFGSYHITSVFDLYPCHFRSADNSVRLFDRRNLTSNGVGSPIHIFEAHKAAVLCVQVISDVPFVF
jgi:hypothetical protein